MLKHNNGAAAANSTSRQSDQISLDRTPFPLKGRGNGGAEKGTIPRPGGRALTGSSAHGARHRFARDAAALAVDPDQEHDADNHGDHTCDPHDGAPQKWHDEDPRDGFR